MAVLSGQKLSCIKRDRTLFENLDFSVEQGQLLHVTGANGAGKTSLLRIIVGLSQPNSGLIEFQGGPISSEAGDFQRSLVYFGHKLGLNPVLSAIENLRFWCELNLVEVHIDHLYELLSMLGLVGLEDLPVSNLSAGQQRRVALTRLWLKPTKIWVLDEPFTALDTEGIAILKDKLASHLAANGSIIMTSHQRLDLPCQVRELNLEYKI